MVNKFSFGSKEAGTESWRNGSLSGKMNAKAAETAVMDRRYVLNNGLSLDKTTGELIVNDKFKQQARDQHYEFDVEQTASGVSINVKKKTGENKGNPVYDTYKTYNFKSAALNAISVKALLTGVATVKSDAFKSANADAGTISANVSKDPIVVVVAKTPAEELNSLLSDIALNGETEKKSQALIAQLQSQINTEDFPYEQSSTASSLVTELVKRDDIDPELRTQIEKLTKNLGIIVQEPATLTATAKPISVSQAGPMAPSR